MFDNIGGKIKGLAVTLTVLGIISSVIGGIVLICMGEDETIGSGMSLLFLGPIFSWISSWFIYGFGQLIENTDKLVARKKVKSERKTQIEDIEENLPQL